MSEFTETTAENLRAIRIEKGMNQDEVAELLGLQNHNISKLESGTRALSTSEKTLLDWYFFGTMPPRLENPLELQGVLEFTATEWDIIGIMAKRAGQTHKQWIRSAVLNIVYGSAMIATEKANGTDGPT